MAEYDGDIKLHVDLGEKNILQSLNDIKKKVVDAFSGKGADELDKHVSNTNKTLQQTQKEFQKVQNEISKTEGKLKELEARYNAIEKTGARAATGSQKYKYNGLFYNKADAVRLEELRARLENMYSTLDGLRERSRDLNNNLSALELGEEPTRQMNDLGKSASEASSKTGGLRSAFSRVLTTIKRFGSTVANVFKKLSLYVAKLARDIAVKLGNAIIAPIKSIGNTVTSLVKRMFTSIRRVFVFSMLTSAFRGMREDIGNLITADTQLAASLKQIQSNLWTAFAPIYTAALPALRSLMGVLSQATGYVAAFFSALTGNTVSQSYSQAQNLKDSATSDDKKKKALDVEIKDINKKIKALNKERKAYEKQKKAEEAANKKSLLNFDTLNQLSSPDVEDEKLQAYDDQLEALQDHLEALQDQKDAIDAVAAAADDLAYPTQAEGAYGKVKNIVDMLKEAWGKGDFSEIGLLISDKLADALKSINWTDIENTCQKIARSIATFINGAVNKENFAVFGEAIGKYINAGINTASTLISTLDWSNLGNSFAAMVNSIIDVVDWYEWGKTISDAFYGITEAVGAFLNSFDWKEAGMAILSFFEGLTSQFLGMTEIDWIPLNESMAALFDQLGRVGEFVFDALFDFYNLFLVPLGQWIMGEGFPRFVSAIADQLALVDWGVLNQALQDLWAAVLPFAEHVGEGLLWFWENVITPLIAWAAESLIPAALELIGSAIQFIDAVIQAAMPAIQALWDNFLNPLLEFMWDIVIDFINLLTDAFKGLSQWAVDNQEVLTLVTEGILGFLAGLWVYNTTKRIIDFIGKLGEAMFTMAQNLSIAGMAGTLANVAFAALGAAILMIVTNWDKMSDMGKVVAVLGTLAVAAVAAAAAVGALQSAWTLGIAAAAIVAGIVAIVAACKTAQSDAVSQMSSLPTPEIDVPSFNLPSELTSLPHLAQGAVIPPNREFMAVLGDQKSGTNIEAPLATIKQAVAEVLSEGGIGGNDNINIKFTGNLAQLARILKPEISREGVRAGSSVITGGNRI